MKKVKFTLCILLIILSFSLCSCDLFYVGDTNFYCYIENVESIQIIRVDDYEGEEYGFGFTVLAEIEDCPTFIERLNDIDHDVHSGTPQNLYINCIVIQINYFNGDYDFIHFEAQRFFRSNKLREGYYNFDKDQYNDLINDYLPDEYKVKT